MQKTIIFLAALLSLASAFAGKTEYNIRKNRSELVPGADSVLTVTYPGFAGYGTPDEIRHQGKVRLEYDRENQSDLTWDYPWRYSVMFKYTDGGMQYDTLTVSYNNGGEYVYSEYSLFLQNTSSDTRTITITDIVGEYYNGSSWVTVGNPHSDVHIPSDIHLELAIITERYYELDENAPISLDYFETENELRWHFTQGAESYDLEWVFIDSASMEYAQVMGAVADGMDAYGAGAGDFEDFYSAELPFLLKEPARVNLTDTKYSTDMLYPPGAVFFRVRAVGVYTGADNPGDDYETVKTGEWNYYIAMGGVIQYNHFSLAWRKIEHADAFAEDQNWLYGISFAEDGKAVSTISYYDGSLRGRQSLVYNTSDDITLVGENKFDYEGRQTVSVIPAPVDGRNFAYQENFNQNTSNTPFEKDDFDKTNPEPLDIDPTGGTKGSAQYFSDNNTFTADQYRSAIPEAEGYVYSQVKFNKDATGRVSEVAGIGETFAMENGHTTRYYYGTANDFELRRLFGDEVGMADNYKKTYVLDPNGQASISYTDNHGRLIATAFAGDAPANLIELDDADEETVTVPLSTDNAVSTMYEKKSRITLVNLAATEYTFDYNFNGVLYGVENPDEEAELLCAKCVYNLYFHIEDTDGDTLAGSDTLVTFSAAGIDDCGGAGITTYIPDNGDFTFGTFVFTDTGEYNVIKRLVVDYDAIIDSALVAADDMLGGFENFADSILANVDLSGCFTNCEMYCEYKMMTMVNLTGDWNELDEIEQQELIDSCMTSDCSGDDLWTGDPEENWYNDETPGTENDFVIGAANTCEGIKLQMIEQLSPGGLMYQDLDDPSSPGSIFWSWDVVEGDLGSLPGSLSLYPTYNDDCTPTFGATHIDDIPTLQNPANFQPCWIDLLLPYHREYCHYEICLQLLETENGDGINSLEFDYMLANLGPWPGDPDISDYVTTTSIEPLDGSDIEFDVNASIVGTFLWSDMVNNMPDSVCGGTTGLDLDVYIDSLWICLHGLGALSAQDSIDKWNLFVGKYVERKNIFLNYYKEYHDGLGTYENGCMYYDTSNIVVNPIFPEDSLANQDSFDNTAAWIEAQMGTVLSFNCADQCDINVTSWMQSFPDTCQQAFDAGGGVLGNELDSLLQEYCNTSCQDGNVFGWFYNNESPQYDSVVTFFDDNNLGCGLESIEIDTANLEFDTDVSVNILSLCLTELIEVINENLPGTSTPVSVDNADTLYQCLDPLAATFLIIPNGDTINTVYATDAVCLREILEFYDMAGDSINLYQVDSIKNLSASQLDIHVAYAEVYFGDSVVTAKLLFEGTCFESAPQYILNYTPDSIPNPIIDCIDETYASAIFEAQQIYNTLLNDLVNELIDSIDCMTGIIEQYTATYPMKEYQYTLYYYDLAGNLTTTVPPLGVHPLDQSTFDAAYEFGGPNWTVGNNPDHELQTTYTYNGANQLVQQFTDDSDTSNYFYDDLFRLRFSQNAQQKTINQFSYIKYDELGRVIEAGEAGDPDLTTINFISEVNDNTFPGSGYRREHMFTYYEEGQDLDGSVAAEFNNGQQNLRNRIGAVVNVSGIYSVVGPNVAVEPSSLVISITSYSYDFHGNVNELVQSNSTLSYLGHKHKKIDYEYDLISGNVSQVSYQQGEPDEWQHKYHYDANNRLVRTFTSDDGEEWEMDAKYFYYLHGSLARVETGHDKVQGTDYAYNMQGWLKGVNSTTLQPIRDNGGDAKTADLDKYAGTDVYGFSLGYFDGDYTPISATAFANTDALITANSTYGNLYNGNISHMVTAMKDETEDTLEVLGNIYKYDQLQRIKAMDVYSVSDQGDYTTNNSFIGATAYNSGAYRERYWFDKNGNIDSLERDDDNGTLMDDFTYNYHSTKKNSLLSVDDDPGNSSVSAIDVDDQNSNNYTYNAIGQLVKDDQENIDTILWSVTDKVRRITKDGNIIEFVYDAMGNRIMKIDGGVNNVDAVYTYYVYDASGNVMATYNRQIIELHSMDEDYNDELSLSEKMIYGSNRIGLKNENRLLAEYDFTPTSVLTGGFYESNDSETSVIDYPENFEKQELKAGEKYYEFSNHLGNVLEVTTDRKIRNSSETNYEADVISFSDYSPFGMLLAGRNANPTVYRYGMDGMEKDDEISGSGNSYSAEYWQYDSRLGRRWNLDPVVKPHESPYAAFANNPIIFIDPSGADTINVYQSPVEGNPNMIMTSFSKVSIDNTGLHVLYHDINGNPEVDANGSPIYRTDFKAGTIEYKYAHSIDPAEYRTATRGDAPKFSGYENWQTWVTVNNESRAWIRTTYRDDKGDLQSQYKPVGPTSYATFTVYFNNDLNGFNEASIINWSETNEVINNIVTATSSETGRILPSNQVSYSTGFNISGMGVLVAGYHSPDPTHREKGNTILSTQRANNLAAALKLVLSQTIDVQTFNGGEKTRSATIIIGAEGNLTQLMKILEVVPPTIGE